MDRRISTSAEYVEDVGEAATRCPVILHMLRRDRLKVGGVMRHDGAGRTSIGREQCGLVRMFRS